MKITKSRLNKIITEEVSLFVKERKVIKEVSGYVMDMFEQMKAKYGTEELLNQLVNYLNDSELVDAFRFISKQSNQPEPQTSMPSPEVPDSTEKQELEESK